MRACCQDRANLRVTPLPEGAPEDRIVRVCIVCGARHIELTAEPGVIGVTLHT